MQFQCNFQYIELPGVGSRYCCYLYGQNTGPCEVKSFIGQHQRGQSNQNVQGLYASGHNFHYLPTGISKFFPQLIAIQVYNCGLKEISAEALKGLENLESLNLQMNQLTSLPDNLFIHTKKLKWIDFGTNKLETMSSRVLEPLIGGQLQKFYFDGLTPNVISYYPSSGGGVKTVKALQKSIDKIFGVAFSIEEEMTDLEESMWCGFKKLWQMKDFSDFKIVVGEKEFPVHKNVLAVQSSVFASMFKTDEDVKTSNKLEIKDCIEDIVEDFIGALYTGEIENKNNKQHALDLFSLASTFNVPELKAVTEILAMEELNEENAVKALTLGNLYNSDVIIDAAFEMIKEMHPHVEIGDALKHKPERIVEVVKTIEGFKEAMANLNSV